MKTYFEGYNLSTIDQNHQKNAKELMDKIEIILTKFGSSRPISSGYRSLEKHKAIYEAKNKDRKAKGLDLLSIPLGSKHLIGAAVDISDADGKLKSFIKQNQHILVELDLYCEHFDHTPTWCHFQIIPPKSKNRFFIP